MQRRTFFGVTCGSTASSMCNFCVSTMGKEVECGARTSQQFKYRSACVAGLCALGLIAVCSLTVPSNRAEESTPLSIGLEARAVSAQRWTETQDLVRVLSAPQPVAETQELDERAAAGFIKKGADAGNLGYSVSNVFEQGVSFGGTAAECGGNLCKLGNPGPHYPKGTDSMPHLSNSIVRRIPVAFTSVTARFRLRTHTHKRTLKHAHACMHVHARTHELARTRRAYGSTTAARLRALRRHFLNTSTAKPSSCNRCN